MRKQHIHTLVVEVFHVVHLVTTINRRKSFVAIEPFLHSLCMDPVRELAPSQAPASLCRRTFLGTQDDPTQYRLRCLPLQDLQAWLDSITSDRLGLVQEPGRQLVGLCPDPQTVRSLGIKLHRMQSHLVGRLHIVIANEARKATVC